MEAAVTAGRVNQRTTAAAIALAMFVCGAVLIGLTVYVGWSSNIRELDAERKRIDNALDQNIAGILDQQRSVAWWDDAVVRIAQRFDEDFVDSNFGLFLTETYQQDEVYILDGADKLVYAYQAGGSKDASLAKLHLRQVQDVVDGVRHKQSTFLKRRPDAFLDRQGAYQKLGGVRATAGWFSAVLLVDGVPSIVTAITISPNVDMTLISAAPHVLVSTVRLDEAFWANLGRSLLIPALRLAGTQQAVAHTASQLFVADDGKPAGFLTWRTAEPGRPLLTVILPLVSALVVAVGILTGRMLVRLSRAAGELQRREAQALHDALHDSLSGLPNRKAFIRESNLRIAAASAAGRSVVLGYIDVDRFKDINDTLGHHAGDRIIQEFGRRLAAELPATTFLARIGGDEFAILQTQDPQGPVDAVWPTIAAALATPLAVDGHSLTVTTSVGLARMSGEGGSCDELLQNADIALYEAKRSGRNCAVVFSDTMAHDLRERRNVETDLAEAIDRNELELYYQPIVATASGRIECAEALLRWFHPTRGSISPAVFIPIAEEVGLMPKLGEWVLRRAVAQTVRWPLLQIAVNLSPAQFRHMDIETLLTGIVGETGADPRRIVLEITESVLLDHSPRTVAALQALRAAGFRIALDDFGTGFSSLKYLMDFKFDKLKIDRSFIKGIDAAPTAATIVESIVRMGHALGISVTAEGVETAEEHRAMRRLGCDDMQGYLFSRPLPEAGFFAFAASFNAAAERARSEADGPASSESRAG